MEIQLHKPIELNGETVSEINLDLESLTGDDLIKAETEYTAINGALVGVPELSKAYLIHVAARAAKMNPEDLRGLAAKDYSKLTMEVQSFLLK